MQQPAPKHIPTKEAGEASRRDQILAAAREVFREKGYDRTTVADVVRHAGVAQGTFYLYFPSKKEAFFALAQELPRVMTQAVMASYDPTASFEDRVRQMTRAGFTCCGDNEDLVRLMRFGADSLANEVHAQMWREHPMVLAIAAMLRKDMQDGAIVEIDPEATARVLMGMYEGALLQARLLESEEEVRAIEDALINIVIRALKKDGAKVQTAPKRARRNL